MTTHLRRVSRSAILAAVLPFAAHAQTPQIGPPVRIDPNGGTAAANETTGAGSDARPGVFVAGWNDWRLSTNFEIINAGFSLSFDHGATWNDFLLRPPAQFQSTVEGDPMTAFDPRTGTLWGGAISFGSSAMYVARLDPGDTEFNPAAIVDVAGGIDKCWMAAGPIPGNPDSTRVYVGANFGVYRSDDMGDTWSNPVSIDSGLGFLPRVAPDGTLYVAYWDYTGSGNRMAIARSTNGGLSFTDHTIAIRMDTWSTETFNTRFPGTFRVPPLVYFDVDPGTGHLHACYFDTTNIVNGQRNVDLYYTKSTNQGTSWSTPVVINGDNNPPGDQFFPWLEIDQAGRIHIVFFDSRHTVQNDNTTHGMFDAYYTYSDDGGQTWNEHRLTEQPWDSDDDGLNRSAQFLGDYLGLAVAGNTVVPVYLDTANGDPDVYTRVITFGSNAPLEDVTVVRGTLLSGGLAQIQSSDDDRLRVRSAPGLSAMQPHVAEIQVATVVPTDATSLSVTVESSVDQPAGTATIALRNWTTGNFDTLASHAVGMNDSTHAVNVPNLADYVRDSDGRVEVRSKHVVVAPLTANGFVARHDLVELTFAQ